MAARVLALLALCTPAAALAPGSTVTVIGASGNVGKLVALRLSETFKVRGVVRSAARARSRPTLAGLSALKAAARNLAWPARPIRPASFTVGSSGCSATVAPLAFSNLLCSCALPTTCGRCDHAMTTASLSILLNMACSRNLSYIICFDILRNFN